MPTKIAVAPKKIDPKEKPARRPNDKEAPSAPDDCKHPTRDTRETPAPNPNGKPVETDTTLPPP
jgi:hypothetical protein